MPTDKVLILDDDLDWQTRIGEYIENIKLKPVMVGNIKAALKAIGDCPEDFLFALIDVVLTEQGDDRQGLIFIDQLRNIDIQMPFILFSENLSVTLETMVINDYDEVIAAIDKEDFFKFPSKVNSAIQKARASRKKTNFINAVDGPYKTIIENGIIPGRIEKSMVSPQDQLAVGILLQGVKFLFSELGRRLEFWRKKKGENKKPKTINIIKSNSNLILKLDDIEKQITTINLTQIESSLEILRRNLTTCNTYREELALPTIAPDKKAFLKIEIPRLQNEINQEGDRLKNLIEGSLE